MKSDVTIVLAGMLDTKAEEFRWMADLVRYYGGTPLILDLSLGAEAPWADISLSQVLASVGRRPAEIAALSRMDALEIVCEAAAKKTLELFGQGRVDGIISWAGSIGTTAATAAMRALPVGVPKVMLSTAASGDTARWLGVSDIYITNPISEKGVSRLTRQTVGNGVASVVAMARRRREQDNQSHSDRPMAALTLYGVTTSPAVRCGAFMKARGWDPLYFHQVGTGAAMEDLIRQGEIGAVFDLSPGELVNNYFHSRSRNPDSWPGRRFTAAFEAGIPAVAAPGAVESTPFGSWDQLPTQFKEELADGRRVSYRGSGKPFFHSPQTLVLPTTLEENRRFAIDMVEQINGAKGPVCLLVPMRGWSGYDHSAQWESPERHFPPGEAGPMWIGAAQREDWSGRAVDFWDETAGLCPENPHINALACDLHLLDPEFSQLACDVMADMLEGRWGARDYRKLPHVIEVRRTTLKP